MTFAWVDNYTERSTGSQTTVYISGHFEKNTTTGLATSYHAFNGQTIAMRQAQTTNMELPSMGSGASAYQYAPAGSEWTWSGGGSGLSANNTAFTNGSPNAPQGLQVAFIQLNGAMQRTVSTTAGQYVIYFKATQRRNTGTGDQTLRVLVDGALIGTFTPSRGGGYDALSTAAFALSAGSHIIRFEGAVSTGDVTAFVDAVSLETVSFLHPSASLRASSNNLGSASMTTNNAGSKIAEARFMPPERSAQRRVEGWRDAVSVEQYADGQKIYGSENRSRQTQL